MMGIIIVIHVVVCIALITVVLIQSGRGGGLVENFSGLESVFGTKTNTFLTRSTGILATLFILTCLSLAFMSLRQSRSLMGGLSDQSRNEQSVPLAHENVPAAQSAASRVEEKQAGPAAQPTTQSQPASSQEQEPFQKE